MSDTRKGADVIVLLNDEIATKQSDTVSLAGVKKATLFLKSTNHVAGNGVFLVEVSPNGTDWYTYNKLINNVANSNAQQKTRTAAPTYNTNTSGMFTIDPDDAITYFRVKVTVTTDGKFSAHLITQK